MNRKNIKFIVPIVVLIGGLILSYLKFFFPQKEPVITLPVHNTKIEIKGDGDNVSRDKIINTTTVNVEIPQKELKQVVKEKAAIKADPIINNGIVNSGVNNGTQTVNNVYNEKPPRKINKEDLTNIRYHIPLDYKIEFIYVNNTEESTNYANEVFLAMKEMGYVIVHISSTQIFADGKPYRKDERIDFTINPAEKKAQIVIKEQR